MNIAVIAKVNNPIKEPFAGGLESLTYMLCVEYLRQGHSVTLYGNQDSDERFDVVSFNNPKVYEDPYADQYEADEYSKIMHHISEHSYDIIHNNSYHPIPIIYGARLATPMVTTLHTPAYSSLKAVTSLASYSSNLKFVAVSKSLKKAWQPYIQSDISVIHNGIKLEEWSAADVKKPYLFWYGRIVHNKGLDIALDAAHEVGLPLLFAGPITDKKYYKDLIEPKLSPQDTYLGHLTQKQINPYLAASWALINSARWEEPFGLSTVEAMASGTSVIGFDRGALREIIQTEGGVIAEGTNVQSLVKALDDIDTSRPQAARELSKQFSIKRTATQYMKYFEELV